MFYIVVIPVLAVFEAVFLILCYSLVAFLGLTSFLIDRKKGIAITILSVVTISIIVAAIDHF